VRALRALLGALALVVTAVALPVAARSLSLGEAAPQPLPPLAAGPAPEVPSGVGDVDSLSPAMRRAVRLATEAAAADGIALRVTSGWRSADHQRRLFEAAVRKYGSPAAARRWVLPPDESAHVQGRAIDVGPEEAARWLERHGVRFGLCRRYANEPWHFERLAAARGSACPALEPHP
jgi:zinc D-Ala-D-Ala carboxypeptidase